MAVVAAVGVRLRFPNIQLADTPSDLERTLRTAFATLMDLDVSVDDTSLISVLPGSVVVQVGAEGRLDPRLSSDIIIPNNCTIVPLTLVALYPQTETVFTTAAGAAAFATRLECCSTDLFNRTFHDGACNPSRWRFFFAVGCAEAPCDIRGALGSVDV
jgi:hypothetical protein